MNLKSIRFSHLYLLALSGLLMGPATGDTTITITGDPSDPATGTVSVNGENGAGISDSGRSNTTSLDFEGVFRIRQGISDSAIFFGVPRDSIDFTNDEIDFQFIDLDSPFDVTLNGVAVAGVISNLFLDDNVGDDFGFGLGTATLETGEDPRTYSIASQSSTFTFPNPSGFNALNLGSYSRISRIFGDSWTLVIQEVPAPVSGDGGSEVLLTVNRRGSPTIVILPTVPEPDPEPVMIIDVGAQLSAETTGQAVSNSVNQGGRGSFTGFTNGVSNHLNGMTGLGGLGGGNGGTASVRANTQLNVRIAGVSNRWQRPNKTASVIAGVMSEPLSVETYVPQWELYTMGAFNLQDQDAIGLAPGYTSDAFSGGVGIERRLGNHFLVGVATTLGENSIEAGGGAGGTDIDGVVLDAYGVYAKDHFWTSLRYGIGFMDLDINRNAFPGATARAETDSLNHVISWGGGLNLPLNLFGMEFIHGPNLGLDYTTGKIDGYRESGAGAFNLVVDDHAYGSLLSEVGWTLAREHDLGKLGRGWLQLRAGWNHEHLLDESQTEIQFETSPISVFDPATGTTTAGPDVSGRSHNPTPQNDYMSVGLHLTQFLGAKQRWVLRTGYQTQLFRSDFSEHYGYMRAGFRF